MHYSQSMLKRFLAWEALGGIMLFLATIIAMSWVNSPFDFLHQQLVDKYIFFINEGLMTLFFLLVGLELKRGYQGGQYSHLAQMLMPVVAALGGMLLPALIYMAFNYHNPDALRGWATPVATESVGSRVPPKLRLFLLALAIFDDIGAILIITLFYSHELSLYYVYAALALTLILYLLHRYAIKSLLLYLILGACLWYALLRAGVHPTIGGVILALFLPDDGRVEDALHPWVTLLIMPLFALANAGFPLQGVMAHLDSTVALGIVLGLFLGKQLGVFGSAWLLIRIKVATLPGQCSWRALYGVSLLCGIGFTMSLFLGTLSFQGDNSRLIDVRLGVLVGSVLSGVIGALVLLGKEKPR
jgi:NhaA family Na+:H+ antiporter